VKMENLEITLKDWNQVEGKVREERDRRNGDKFRKDHEMIWKEVDRMVAMKPMQVVGMKEDDWHSAIELGELARASEIITADVMRLIFPNTRSHFEAHIEIPPQLDPNTGENVGPNNELQTYADGVCRAMMTKQHHDFGFKHRVELSVKEALHHGSFVAKARMEDITLFSENGGIKTVRAPVWVPHSMWNCYPDPSPSIIGTNMFYTGSMIIDEYMPLHRLKQVAASGTASGWMPSQLKKVKRRQNKNKDVDTQDIELTCLHGDIIIDKSGEDIFLPNSEVILANGTIVFYRPNPYPFQRIIYNGYERLDVRDPYYTSPLIKLSPLHKLASTMANKFVDCTALNVEPPTVYDSNDPQMAMMGGPKIVPATHTGTKYMGKGVAPIPLGDPRVALEGLTAAIQQIKEGTPTENILAGKDGGDVTATQVRQDAARREVRVVDFVDKLEYSIKSFLYMQHEMNRKEMEIYAFYNPELDAPDFMRLSNDEIQYNAHFDVVGSRGILGEEELSQRMTAVTAFASGNPLFAPLLKSADLLKEMYLDAGVKNPERFLNIEDGPMQQIKQELEQKYQQLIEEGKQMIFDLREKLAIQQAVNGAKIQEATILSDMKATLSTYEAKVDAEMASIRSALKIAEHKAKQEPQDIGQVASLVKEIVKGDEQEHKKKYEDLSNKVVDITKGVKELATAVEKNTKAERTEVEVEYDGEGRISSVNGKKIKRKGSK